MKVLIVDTIEFARGRPPKPDAKITNAKEMSVTSRNALVIAEYLRHRGDECDILDSRKIIFRKKYDIILFSYASLYFDFAPVMRFVETQTDAKIGWITNEYNLQMNSCYKDLVTFVISNFKHPSEKINCLVNLNTLICEKRNPKVSKKYDLIYYGTFRVNRTPYFKKYLHKPLLLSASKKNHKKFKEVGATCNFIDKLSFQSKRQSLNWFRASLYIEDTETHSLYNHLANRFYEALACNTVLFFDRSCQNTIDQSQCAVDSFFVVDSIDDIRSRLKDLTEERAEDFLRVNTELALNEKNHTLETIYKFLKNL